MTDKRRPISPHLQVYRLPITGILSISHRITGVLLSFALIATVYVFASIALGEASYLLLQQQLSGWIGKFFYLILVYALLFHLCHGARHLLWDIGKGFDRQQLTKLSVYEILASLILTLVWMIFSL